MGLDLHAQLTTDRLRLRPLTMHDADWFQRLAGDEQLSRTALGVPHPLPQGGGEMFLALCETGRMAGTDFHFAVVELASGEMVGVAALSHLDPDVRKAELGYWIGRPYWGRGYATEAGRELVRWGFGPLDLNKIHANTIATNDASGRVLTKLGFTQEGLFRQDALHRGEYVDLIYYGLLRQDYAG